MSLDAGANKTIIAAAAMLGGCHLAAQGAPGWFGYVLIVLAIITWTS